MAYRVELTERALRDIADIYLFIDAATSEAALRWFTGLESAIFSLDESPNRGTTIKEYPSLRHLLYGNKPHIYRIIFEVNEISRIVSVVAVRHGAERPFRR